MKSDFFESSFKQTLIQRNILVFLCLLLALAVILLSSFLFLKRERIILVPPHIEKELWVDSNGVSPTYLEQFGSFMAQLLLSKNINSAPNQRSIILRHTDVRYASALRQKLLEEEEFLKKQNASYVFYPVDTKVDPEKMEVLISGERILFFNEKQLTMAKEKYLLKFTYNGMGLFLISVTNQDKN